MISFYRCPILRLAEKNKRLFMTFTTLVRFRELRAVGTQVIRNSFTSSRSFLFDIRPQNVDLSFLNDFFPSAPQFNTCKWISKQFCRPSYFKKRLSWNEFKYIVLKYYFAFESQSSNTTRAIIRLLTALCNAFCLSGEQFRTLS